MLASTLDILVDPHTHQPLHLTATKSDPATGEILEGSLRSESGETFQIHGGIPRMVPAGEQIQTRESFGYKWGNQGAYERADYLRFIERDEVPRWGLRSMREFYDFFPRQGRVLEAGCGSAHFASLYVPHLSPDLDWVAVDLSAAIDIARKRLRGVRNRTDFVQGNALELPFPDQTFDHVFSRGVLHHTPSTRAAFESCVRVLRPGGEFTFLIYRKMGPVREFTDDHIRSVVSRMRPEEGWKALESLTKFGRALKELKVQVKVPENIPFLEIPAGTYDLQQLVYDHFVKAYWNPALDFETNQHNTFDWYHPQFAFHHTEEEIRAWCAANGMKITFIKPMWTSWAVRAVKQ